MEASKLKEILDQHQLWLDGRGGQRANLEDADLTGADLTGAYLSGADLFCADLTGADLTGADLTGAYLWRANLNGANLNGANLKGANLSGANLAGAILPDISWIIPGCLVQLNNIYHDFYLVKERNHDSFIQDSLGFFIQDNWKEKSFDMLLGDRIIRNIPHWVKYTGMKQVAAVIV